MPSGKLAATFSALFALCFSFGAAANTFTVSGDFSGGTGIDPFSGTLTIDTTAGQVTAANITLEGVDFTGVLSQGPYVDSSDWLVKLISGPAEFDLFLFTSTLPGSLVGYSGGSIDGGFAGGGPLGTGIIGAGGTVTVSETPLPAALPLFASALAGAGLFGWIRRRKQRIVARVAPAV